MDRRQLLVSALGASLAAMGLEGCGGGGGSAAGAGTQTVSGRLVPPAGFTPSLKTLQVSSASGNSPVGADGSYRLAVPTGQSSLVWLADSTGKTVMLGFASQASRGPMTVDITPTTTAVALLFLGTGAFTLNADNFDSVIGLLTQTPQAAQLATVVADRIAANSTAIDDGDSQIASAAQSAAAALLGATKGVARMSPPATATAAKVTVSRAGSGSTRAGGNLVTITSGGPSSGVTVQQSSTNDSIVVVNNYRRWCKFYVYVTGWVDTGGTVTTLTAPQRFGVQNDLPSVGKLGLVASLTAVVQGTSSWVPVSSDPVALPLPAGLTKRFYEIVVIGPSFVPGSGALVSDPRYAGEAATWNADITNLGMKTVLQDFVFPVVFFLLGVKGLIASGVADAIVATLNGQPQATLFYLSTGSPSVVKAEAAFLREIELEYLLPVSQRVLFNNVIGTMWAYVAPRQIITVGEKTLTTGAKLVLGLGLLDALLTSVDIGGVLLDLNRAGAIENFQATAFLPIVRLSPATATIQAGGRQLFTATLPAGVAAQVTGAGGKIVYDWATTAQFGQMDDGSGKPGKTIETAANAVYLDTTPLDTGPITVTVTALAQGLSGGTSQIGAGTAQVAISANSQKYSGSWDVVDFTVMDNGIVDGWGAGAWIMINKVSGAKTYTVRAYNIVDPFVPIPRTWSFSQATPDGITIVDKRSQFWIALSGGTSSTPAGQAQFHAELLARFAGLLVDVTAILA